MKKEVIHFICPVYFLSYILYNDTDGLTSKEVKHINEVLSGYCCFPASEDVFFSYGNDFFNWGADCVTLTALKND